MNTEKAHKKAIFFIKSEQIFIKSEQIRSRWIFYLFLCIVFKV